MGVYRVTMYQAQCDCCLYVETDYGDYSAWGDKTTPVEMACEISGFQEHDGKLYCPKCLEENPDTLDDEPHAPESHKKPNGPQPQRKAQP